MEAGFLLAWQNAPAVATAWLNQSLLVIPSKQLLGTLWLLDFNNISTMFAKNGYALATVGNVPAGHWLKGRV